MLLTFAKGSGFVDWNYYELCKTNSTSTSPIDNFMIIETIKTILLWFWGVLILEEKNSLMLDAYGPHIVVHINNSNSINSSSSNNHWDASNEEYLHIASHNLKLVHAFKEQVQTLIWGCFITDILAVNLYVKKVKLIGIPKNQVKITKNCICSISKL